MKSKSLLEKIALLEKSDRENLLRSIDPMQLKYLESWEAKGRVEQQWPTGDWNTWLCLAGRGWGKTRTGAESVKRAIKDGAKIVGIIGPTTADVRDTLILGPSGILSVFNPSEKPVYEPSKRRVTFKNGSYAICYSAEEPDRLRGPNLDFAWLDEFAAFQDPEAVWDQIQMSLRGGVYPRSVITTTPRNLDILKQIKVDHNTVISCGSTFDNENNLPDNFLKNLTEKYEGTRLGRQELYAEILEDTEGALWTWSTLTRARTTELPENQHKVAIAVDPAIGGKDETGIIVASIAKCKCRGKEENHAYILEDASGHYSPHEWASKVYELYCKYHANVVIAEKNQGGDLVEANLKSQGNMCVKSIHASKGKRARAEPIAALYEQGKVHHYWENRESLLQLENQLTSWSSDSSDSPDRLDALVYALSELMLSGSSHVFSAKDFQPLRLSGISRR